MSKGAARGTALTPGGWEKSRRRRWGGHLMAASWWVSRGHACDGDD